MGANVFWAGEWCFSGFGGCGCFLGLVVAGVSAGVFRGLWLQRLWVWVFSGAVGCGGHRCGCFLMHVVAKVVGVGAF